MSEFFKPVASFLTVLYYVHHYMLLLVQEKTLIGRPDASHQQDIQLLGLGIMPEHCVIFIDGSDVVLIPLDGARCAAGVLTLRLLSISAV